LTAAPGNVFRIKQGDTLPALREQLLNADGKPIDLTTADEVSVQVRRVDGTSLIKNLSSGVTVEGDPIDGQIKCVWDAGDNEVPGEHVQEVRVHFTSGDVVTVPNDREGYPFVVTREAVAG
jgi:hypothetical protein